MTDEATKTPTEAPAPTPPPTPQMTLQQLAQLGKQMREAQRRYFDGKRKNDLQAAIQLEKQFDAAIDAL